MTSSDSGTGTAPTGGRPERRSSDEVRALLLLAAEELFSRHGYTRTSTKSIAARAGVAEVLLFRHFGGKATLFREAVYRPVVDALEAFVEEHLDVGLAAVPPEEAARGLVSTLYDVLSAKRGAMIALAGAQMYANEVQVLLGSEVEHPLARLYLELERIVLRYAVSEDYTGLHPPVTARSVVAMVVASVVYRPWLTPEPDAAGRDEVVEEITSLLYHGVLHRTA